jgi:hypothetical protein
MTDFVIGPGVAAAIAENQDEARSDEQFIILREGDKVSQTIARHAIYYWLERDNVVERSPF